jgi:diguanylate cyclase (GGDEF)-like protein
MRIRVFTRAYMMGMGLLVLGGISVISSQQWSSLSNVKEARALVRVLAPALRFVEAMALERGDYNQVLVSKEAGSESARRMVAEGNATTDRVFQETTARLWELPAALRDEYSKPVLLAWQIVDQARRQVDKVWQDQSTTSPEAGLELVKSFIKARGLIDSLIASVHARLNERNPRLGLMFEISRLSNDMREAAGLRSTFLTRYAATMKPLDPETSAKVSELTGQIAITWSRLERIANQLDRSPKIQAAVAKTRGTFIENGERMYARMAEAARAGASPPMQLLSWRAWTVDMLGNVLGARDAPVEQALDLLDETQRSATERLWFVLAALGLAAVGVLAAGLCVERRIVKPLTRLTQEIERVTDCDPVDETGNGIARPDVSGLAQGYAARQDEIGSLARALVGFQHRTTELGQLNKRFDAALANMPQGLCFFNADQELVVCNKRYAELYGLTLEQTQPGTSLRSILQARNARGVIQDAEQILGEVLANAGNPFNAIRELQNGRAVSVHTQPMPDGGWIATHEDVTDRRKADAQIAYLAHHDALTGLPNRLRFQQEMDRALNEVGSDKKLAVLCLDLDRFKAVNDSLGHSFGDMLLQQVARRLKECVRDGDTIARLGGDEFAIINPGIEDPQHAGTLAQRIINRLCDPYDLDGYQAIIGTSVGIAVGPADGQDSVRLLKSADMALYRAKADGRGICRFFQAEMDAWLQRRRALEMDLRKALSNGELELHYQPVLQLTTNEITGFEALLRWNHPQLGRIYPADFIPLAEETNLIGEIGAWVLKQACIEAMTWPSQIRVAVNLSATQFEHRRVALDVVAALSSSHLPANRLEVEITEAVMLRNTDSVVTTLHQLRELGVRISMDDFGTGYSSLSYLRKFPFDKIKIDRCFVQDLETDRNAASIVRAVIGLGAGLGISTNAEGVETKEQLARLRAEGCAEIQGYLLSPPIPSNKIAELLGDTQKNWAAA